MPALPHLLPSRLREGPGEGEPAGSGAGSRRRHRHRVDKSRPGRHARPADVGRECRPLPTRPICRHFRRQMPTVRARRRGVGIFDPRVGMSRRNSSRNPSVTGSAVGGPRRFFRHARNKSIAVRLRWVGSGTRHWYRRVSGPSAGSGHGSRPGRTNPPCPPAVTPDLIRGPEPQAPLSPGFPGPRIKSGVTTGGQRRSRLSAESPSRG